MEHRNVHHFAQALLNNEAIRRFDIFQINAAERRTQIAHSIDEGVNVGGVNFQIDGINISKAFEQD